jgi:hypothetical protein
MEIQAISFVSKLRWKAKNDDCLLCNNPIGHNCIKCTQLNNNIECMSIINKNLNCQHSYHAHCLQHYHESHKLQCPMCTHEWT